MLELRRRPARDADPETRHERRSWAHVRRAEIQYGRDLRGVAREIAQLVSMLGEGESENTLIRALELYAETIRPWARASAARMLADVSRRDEAMWNTLARSMRRNLREELERMPIGDLFRQLQESQVALITSLPLKAAQQVHEMMSEARISTAERAGVLADRIGNLGDITAARAMLIARTETARAASNLVQARAQFVGSEGYIWRSSGDTDVRPLHKKLNGKYFKWSEPPVSGERGEKAHAGCIYNCRCFSEPVLPDYAAGQHLPRELWNV
jgi:SPP1 gp7 family putative phage head morphogenesis protein